MTQPRPACPADLSGLADLERRCFPIGPWTQAQVAGERGRSGGATLVMAAPDGAGPAGYACGWALAGEGEVLRVAVDPAWRRHGFGLALLAALERSLAPRADRLFLEVRADNEPAIGLYLRRGYRREGMRRAYYADGTDALVMARPLDAPDPTGPCRTDRSC